MSETGDVKRWKQDGKCKKATLATCIHCGETSWVQSLSRPLKEHRCRSCASEHRVYKVYPKGEKASNWRGGRFYDKSGYVMVWVDDASFYAPMIKQDRYAREHRLIMAMHLGRNLHSWETVHHKNGIKDDNRIGNLELATPGGHSRSHSKGYRDGYAKGLVDGGNERIRQLEIENAELRKPVINPHISSDFSDWGS